MRRQPRGIPLTRLGYFYLFPASPFSKFLGKVLGWNLAIITISHFTTNQKRIADLAKTYRLPAIHSRRIGSTEMAYGADQGEPYGRRSNCINARPVYAAASLILAESTSRIRKIENTPHAAKVSSNENYKE